MSYFKIIKDDFEKKQTQFLICLAWLLKTEDKFGFREILSFKIYDFMHPRSRSERKLSNDRIK